MSRHCTGLVWGIALLLAMPPAADAAPQLQLRSATGIAEPFGDSLTLFGTDFLPPAAAQPWLQGNPAARDYLRNWPEQVTLQAWQFGPPDPQVERRVLLIGGIHGDEAVSTILPTLLIGQLTAECRQRNSGTERLSDPPTLFDQLIATNTQLVIVPLVNPYGTLAGERANFRRPTPLEDYLGVMQDWWPERPSWWDLRKGVDLNRNFPVNLPTGGAEFQRSDGEGTHDFSAPGGCLQQHLYYGGLLQFNDIISEPANRWLWALVQQLQPDVTLALHQENRCIYVDTREAKAVSDLHWTRFIAEAHDTLNAPAPHLPEGITPPPIQFGIRADGSAMPPENCINDFSPGGYGAALSLASGVVLTVEMSYDQSDAEDQACWFPEGLLFTYSDDLACTHLRNVPRLSALVERFKQPLVQWMLYLDPNCPELFRYDRLSRPECDRLLLPTL